jgi:hypothetical protein
MEHHVELSMIDLDGITYLQPQGIPLPWPHPILLDQENPSVAAPARPTAGLGPCVGMGGFAQGKVFKWGLNEKTHEYIYMYMYMHLYIISYILYIIYYILYIIYYIIYI